ncbi:MAG: MIP family channel protein [Pyrinomonadaceae bacterium]
MNHGKVSATANWRTTVWGEMAAEFLGTFVMIAFGSGVVAMAVAALNQSGRGELIFAASGDWLLIAAGWALAVTFGVYVAGGISGAHLNPAITLALAVRRGFPWAKVLPYAAAQLLGAYAGAALVYLNYRDAIGSFERAGGIVRGTLGGAGDSSATVGIFATGAAPYYGTSYTGPLIDQIIGTMLLVLVIFALTDARNQPPKSNLAPLVIGLLVAAIGISFGANAGYAINPARDFGPRLFAWMAGWGEAALPGANYYFWIPIVGPIAGSLLGAFTYDLFIRDVLAARHTMATEDVETKGETVKEKPVAAIEEF